jgi:DNA invertase Pin-like site-specific DNA recombinase
MVAKGRARSRTVRTPAIEDEVRLRHRSGESKNSIARSMSIGRATVYRILRE